MLIALVAVSVLLTAAIVFLWLKHRKLSDLYEYADALKMTLEHYIDLSEALHMDIAKHNARKANLELGVVLPPAEENNN